jgi:hypothetical protein
MDLARLDLKVNALERLDAGEVTPDPPHLDGRAGLRGDPRAAHRDRSGSGSRNRRPSAEASITTMTEFWSKRSLTICD